MNAKLFGLLVPAVVILSFASTPSFAQGEVLMSKDASECDIFRTLKGYDKPGCELDAINPGAGSPDGELTLDGATQGLSVADPSTQGSADTDGPTVATSEPQGSTSSRPQAAAFPSIQFEFNSAALTSSAMRTLETLAAVLQDPGFAGDKFVIEGHTDAVGSPDYNQALSEQRARSVVGFLVQHSGIPANRFTPRGRGESEPYDAHDPTAAVNRRVVVLISGS